MTRVNLRFQASLRHDLSYRDKPLSVVRLVVDVRFRLPPGDLSEVYEGIVDTGAYVMVIPCRIWRSVEREVFTGGVSFGGVKGTKRCQVRADLGTVTCTLSDRDGNSLPPVEVPAYLAHTDRVPLLGGFAGLLTRCRTTLDCTTGEAWLKESKGIG